MTATAQTVTQQPAPPMVNRKAAATAAIALLLMAILAPIANFGIIEPLATDITGHNVALNIWLGMGLLAGVIVLDVIVAVTLGQLFNPVNRTLSMFTAAFRILYALIFAAAVLRLNDAAFAVFDHEVYEAVHAFTTLWDIALIIFGIHLFGLAILSWKSGFIPKIIAALLAIAGLGYLFDSIIAILLIALGFEASVVTFIGEVALLIWLFILAFRTPAPFVNQENRG